MSRFGLDKKTDHRLDDIWYDSDRQEWIPRSRIHEITKDCVGMCPWIAEQKGLL